MTAARHAAPRLTVGIPTRQRLALLREAVAAALAQTNLARAEEIEVLISQDVFPATGPDAALLAWCREAAADGRIRHQVAPRPLGLAGNWNAVIAAARGEFVVIPGDDDRLLPEFAATLLAAADAHGADVVFSDHFVMNSAGERDEAATDERTRQFARATLPPGPVAPAEPWLWRNAVPMLSALVRTDLARRFPFHEDLNTPELEFFLRLAQAGASFVFVPARLAEYRLHDAAATAAGLWSDRLARRLLALPAGQPAAQEAKTTFLRGLLPNAVSRALARGDKRLAREFLESKYYPRDASRLSAWALRFCAALPGSAARSLRRVMCAARDWRKERRGQQRPSL
ncbi:MAG: glycosyltransferase [Verrucomicrobia bacterium]|nr:glycosyltransferase [Verrucomicrobiota bacterium]